MAPRGSPLVPFEAAARPALGDWEIFFQVYGSDTAARRVETQADAGAGGVYSAQVPVVLGADETIAVGFCIDGVEYLQPLVRITGLSDHSMTYEDLLEQK